MRICAIKSSPSFFSLSSADLLKFSIPSSPANMMSSSTLLSSFRQCKALMAMTRAAFTSHFLARRKRNNNASGWSCFTIPQNASRNSSGVIVDRACLNALFTPCLSSSPILFAMLSGVGVDVGVAGLNGVAEELIEESSSSVSSLYLRMNMLRPLRFRFEVSGLASGEVLGVEVPLTVYFWGTYTPDICATSCHSSRSFASCSGVRLPGRPGWIWSGIPKSSRRRSSSGEGGGF